LKLVEAQQANTKADIQNLSGNVVSINRRFDRIKQTF
jgi:hypothetical protein